MFLNKVQLMEFVKKSLFNKQVEANESVGIKIQKIQNICILSALNNDLALSYNILINLKINCYAKACNE